VCALYREGVEIPSDYSGVLYVKLDPDGGWRLQLAKEVKAAGMPVDMNKAL
jgi:predicted nucleotide-binding protein